MLTAGMARRLRRKMGACLEQDRTYRRLIQKFAQTSYWREAGVEAGLPYEKFRTRVAPRTHDQLTPAFERMQRGEADVLWPGTCALFAETAGTSTGLHRIVPATDGFLSHLRTAGFEALLHYTARVGHSGVFRGRHLLLGGVATLRRVTEAPVAAFAGDVSGIAMINLPPWAERHLYEPGAGIAR
ncbi:MAG: GH3 auxin-responsive promoter family protein, partial [Opitutus sp.]